VRTTPALFVPRVVCTLVTYMGTHILLESLSYNGAAPV